MFELLGGHLPGVDGRFKLLCMCRRYIIERDRSFFFEHLRVLLGGLLLVDYGGHRMRGLLRGERCVRLGGIELCAVYRRQIRGGDEFIDVHCLLARPVPDGCRRFVLHWLPGWSIRDHDRSEPKRLLELRSW